MHLTDQNYYSPEANASYISTSQFKDFMSCPAMAVAKLAGDHVEPESEALKLGSYMDELLTGSGSHYIVERFDEIHTKQGKRREAYEAAYQTHIKILNQPLMMHYLSGEHQTIMTGTIEGAPFKIKMDSYKPGEFIADLKYMRSLRSPNLFEPMISYWHYDWQAAIYQEIVYQNAGERLPFFFVIATKEKPPHLTVAQIQQYNIDAALDTVRKNLPRVMQIKNGSVEPERCEEYNCDFCTQTRILMEIEDTDLLGMSRAQKLAITGGA